MATPEPEEIDFIEPREEDEGDMNREEQTIDEFEEEGGELQRDLVQYLQAGDVSGNALEELYDHLEKLFEQLIREYNLVLISTLTTEEFLSALRIETTDAGVVSSRQDNIAATDQLRVFIDTYADTIATIKSHGPPQTPLRSRVRMEEQGTPDMPSPPPGPRAPGSKKKPGRKPDLQRMAYVYWLWDHLPDGGTDNDVTKNQLDRIVTDNQYDTENLYYLIQKLVEDGYVKKVKRGTFRITDKFNDFYKANPYQTQTQPKPVEEAALQFGKGDVFRPHDPALDEFELNVDDQMLKSPKEEKLKFYILSWVENVIKGRDRKDWNNVFRQSEISRLFKQVAPPYIDFDIRSAGNARTPEGKSIHEYIHQLQQVSDRGIKYLMGKHLKEDTQLSTYFHGEQMKLRFHDILDADNPKIRDVFFSRGDQIPQSKVLPEILVDYFIDDPFHYYSVSYWRERGIPQSQTNSERYERHYKEAIEKYVIENYPERLLKRIKRKFELLKAAGRWRWEGRDKANALQGNRELMAQLINEVQTITIDDEGEDVQKKKEEKPEWNVEQDGHERDFEPAPQEYAMPAPLEQAEQPDDEKYAGAPVDQNHLQPLPGPMPPRTPQRAPPRTPQMGFLPGESQPASPVDLEPATPIPRDPSVSREVSPAFIPPDTGEPVLPSDVILHEVNHPPIPIHVDFDAPEEAGVRDPDALTSDDTESADRDADPLVAPADVSSDDEKDPNVNLRKEQAFELFRQAHLGDNRIQTIFLRNLQYRNFIWNDHMGTVEPNFHYYAIMSRAAHPDNSRAAIFRPRAVTLSHPTLSKDETILRKENEILPFGKVHGRHANLGAFIDIKLVPKMIYIHIKRGVPEQALSLLATRIFEHKQEGDTRILKKHNRKGKFSYKTWLSTAALKRMGEQEIVGHLLKLTKQRTRSTTIMVRQKMIPYGYIQNLWDTSFSLL